MATFSWAAAADVGLGLFGAWGQAKAGKARAEAENAVREGNNLIASSQRTLAGTIRSINNARIMEHAGRAQDSATTAAVRTSDAVTRRGFEESIRAAEEWGAAAARGAASGTGGVGIQALSQVTSLRIARQKELLESQSQLQTFEASQASTRIMSNALMGLEQGPLTARMDFGRSTAPSMAGMLIQGLLSKRDSLSVMLGSMVPGQGAEVTPIPDQTVVGTPLPSLSPAQRSDFAFTTPVADQNVVGSPLPPRGFEQADIRRIDNVTLN